MTEISVYVKVFHMKQHAEYPNVFRKVLWFLFHGVHTATYTDLCGKVGWKIIFFEDKLCATVIAAYVNVVWKVLSISI